MGCANEAGGDWVVFDVGADFAELFRRAHPMIERFVLPERLPFPREDRIGLMGARAFDSVCYTGKGDFWRDKQVNMVWHQHERVEDKIT